MQCTAALLANGLNALGRSYAKFLIINHLQLHQSPRPQFLLQNSEFTMGCLRDCCPLASSSGNISPKPLVPKQIVTVISCILIMKWYLTCADIITLGVSFRGNFTIISSQIKSSWSQVICWLYETATSTSNIIKASVFWLAEGRELFTSQITWGTTQCLLTLHWMGAPTQTTRMVPVHLLLIPLKAKPVGWLTWVEHMPFTVLPYTVVIIQYVG